MKIALVILLLCAGCSVTEETTEPTVETEESFSILGKWKFEWNKPIGDVEDWINSDRDSTISLLTFFGATGFSESPGKIIEFTSDNRVRTDWYDQEMIDKVQFKYQFYQEDSLLIFSAVSPKDSSKIEMPTVITFDSDVMIWNIENFLAVKLSKMD